MRYEIKVEEYQEIFDSEDWQFVKVIFEFKTPMMLTHPWIHFDGLTEHLRFRLYLGEDYYTLPSMNPIDPVIRIESPIKHINDLPCSSIIFLKNEKHEYIDVIESAKIATIYRRFEERQAHKLQTKKTYIDLGSGIYRNYALKIPYIPAHYGEAYCETKPKALQSILSILTCIGKKVNYGYGELKNIKIEDSNTEQSYYDGHDKIALRPIPIRFCDEYSDTQNIAWKAPYWDKRNVERCVIPLSKCVLK